MRINQIRPEKLIQGAREAYEKDLSFYHSNLSLFVPRNCPACDLPEGTFFDTRDGFSYSRCKSCACIFMNPGPTPHLVEEFYERSENYKFWSQYMYPESRAQRLATIHQKRADWVLNFLENRFPTDSQINILELGAGTGDTLKVISSSKKFRISSFAIEPNPSMKDHLSSNAISDISEQELHTSKYQDFFDIVICFEVLEHILSPLIFLKQAQRNLVNGGYFLASTPNAQSLEIQLLRGRSTTLDVEHISLLAVSSVQILAFKSGYQVLECSTPGLLDLELLNDGGVKIAIESDYIDSSDVGIQKFIAEAGFSSHLKFALKSNS